MQVKGTAPGAAAMLTDQSTSLYLSFYTNTARQPPFTEHLPGVVLISGFQRSLGLILYQFNRLLPRLSEKTPPMELSHPRSTAPSLHQRLGFSATMEGPIDLKSWKAKVLRTEESCQASSYRGKE